MRSILWVAIFSFGWPLIHLIVAMIRFGQSFAGGFTESLIFLPMGVLSGVVLLSLMGRASSRRQRKSSVIGYLIAAPIGFLGSLVGGLVLAPLWGTTLFGGVPLLLGSLIGYRAGKEKQSG